MRNNNFTYNFTITENVTNGINTQYCSSSLLKVLVISSMVLSIIFILITILVYVYINETRNLHGKILVSLSTCLGVSYFLLMLDLNIQPYISFKLCKAMGIITYIMFISSFFWSNIMTFVVWKAISSMKQNSRFCHRRKYFKFVAYVSIITLLVSIPTIILDNTELVHFDFQPKIGTVQCWLKGYTASLIYLSIPIGIILLSNLIMFILIMKTLIQMKNETKILEIKQDKFRFHLYFKLFLAFGLIWLIEFIPLIIDVCFLHAAADILSSLQGLFLFAIFVCKKKVLKQLVKHHKRYDFFHFRAKQTTNEQTTSNEITVVSNSFKYMTTNL